MRRFLFWIAMLPLILTPIARSQTVDLAALKGTLPPAFTLTDLAGRSISTDDYRGRPLILNFWATWCAPCKAETPWLIELRNQYKESGLEILAISMDDYSAASPKKLADSRAVVARFAGKLQIPYPVLLGGLTLPAPYSGFDSLPVTLYIDRSGHVATMTSGIVSRSEIDERIHLILEAK